jgi:hypothetical protein
MKGLNVRVSKRVSHEGQIKDVLEKDKCLLLVSLVCFVWTYCSKTVIGANIEPCKRVFTQCYFLSHYYGVQM